MSDTLEGRVALVTGAGRGIGRAIALKLAEHGASVVVNDLDLAPAQECVELIRKSGGQARECPGSVTASDFAERFIATAMEEYKSVDIIANVAGFTWDSVIQKMTDEQWYAMLDVHLTAPFRILRAAQPIIKALAKADAERGARRVRKIVNVSSIAGLFGNAGQSNYATAKSGVMGLTQSLAKEWGRLNTTVNCIAYGLIKTRLTDGIAGTADIGGREIKVGINADLLALMNRAIPLGRAGTPEDAAGAAYLFCIPESDYVSGQTLLCSGGLTGI